MKHRALGLIAIAFAILVSIGPTVTAGEGTWVAKGHTVHLSGHDAMFKSAGATEIRMEDLNDGETRVIGVGEKQITAIRLGDVVAFSRDAVGNKAPLDLKCKIGSDACRIVTFGDDPERVILIVEKVRRCEHGEGDRRDAEDLHGDEPGATAEVIIESLGAGAHAAGTPGELIFIRRGDQIALRCSEGDTTMHVDPQEADDVFLCPKHSTPLEQVAGHPRVLRHRVQRDLRDSD